MDNPLMSSLGRSSRQGCVASEVRLTPRGQQQRVHLLQFRDDRDWKMAAGNFDTVFLLKTNGTLRRLGSNHFDLSRKTWPGLRAFEPQRLGTNSNGAEIFSDYGSGLSRRIC